jgi:hypothetical protein
MLRLRSYIPYMAGLRLVARRMHLTPNRFTTFPEGVTHVWSLSDPMVCDCDSNAMGGTNYIGHARHFLPRSFERDWRNILITLKIPGNCYRLLDNSCFYWEGIL